MEQAKLPIGFRFSTYSKYIIGGLIALVAVGFFLYYFLVLSRDPLLRYFPKETRVYASFHISEQDLASPLFVNALDVQGRELFKTFIEQDVSKTGRNMTMGLVFDGEGYQPLIALGLNSTFEPHSSLRTLLGLHHYSFFTVSNSFFNSHTLLASPSEEVLGMVKNVINQNAQGLDQDPIISASLNRMIEYPFSVYIDSSYIGELFPDVRAELPDKLFLQGNSLVPVVSLGEHSGDELTLVDMNSILFGLGVSDTGHARLKELLHDNTEGMRIPGDLSPAHVSYEEYEDGMKLRLGFNEYKKDRFDMVRDYFVEYLATIHKDFAQKLLPDGSYITVLAKNRDSIVIETSEIDHEPVYVINDTVAGREYLVVREGNDLVITSKGVASLEMDMLDRLTGCRGGGEYAIFETDRFENTLIQKIFERVLISDSVTGYPQISACLW